VCHVCGMCVYVCVYIYIEYEKTIANLLAEQPISRR
jgi:coenzyme F420-reducing hydrogenase beta subunit